MRCRTVLPGISIGLVLLVLAAGCGGDGDGSGGGPTATTSQPATVTTSIGGDSDARLAFATAANDLGDYCLARSRGKTAGVDPADAIERLLAAYRALGEEPRLREALRQLRIGTCYPDGAARIRDAVGTASAP